MATNHGLHVGAFISGNVSSCMVTDKAPFTLVVPVIIVDDHSLASTFSHGEADVTEMFSGNH